MITLALSMIALFGLLAIGTPVGFAMAGSGVLGLWMIGGMPMLSGILQTAPLSAVTSYELITIPMFLLMAEFVLVSGIDDSFSQTVHARYSYVPAEIRWNARFADIMDTTADGRRTIDFARFHDVTPDFSTPDLSPAGTVSPAPRHDG